MDAANLPVRQSDFDTAMMLTGVGKDIFHYASREAPCWLVFFQDDIHRFARSDTPAKGRFFLWSAVREPFL